MMRSSIKQLRLRYAGTCACGQEVPAGTYAGWNSALRQVTCPSCLGGPTAAAPEKPQQVSVAGESLQREYERRSTKREERVRSAHPRIGGLILALSEEPASTRAFKVGAEGERKAARQIQDRCGPEVLFLLNRALGRGRRDGDIDVIAIGPAGVHVADVKHYKNQKVEVRRSGGLFSAVKEQLFIGGRDKTSLLDSMARQLDAVRTALADLPGGDALRSASGSRVRRCRSALCSQRHGSAGSRASAPRTPPAGSARRE